MNTGGRVKHYWNEIDPYAAAWLRNLIDAGELPPGDVDTRSIKDVTPDDLRGYVQCHFFGGFGGWGRALQLAGYPDDAEIWTGSCPCQPWSDANVWEGGGKGEHDDRHLWPDWYRLIRKCKPARIVGEQVPGAIGKGWLDLVFTDLESEGYSCGAVVLRACDFGAIHRRKRLYFGANAGGTRRARHQPKQRIPIAAPPPLSVDGDPLAGARQAVAGDYRALLRCDGLSVAMARRGVKGFGNAIVPQVAAAFIRAYCESVRAA